MSPLIAPARSRFAGRRLSFGRIALTFVAALSVAAAGAAAAVVPALTAPAVAPGSDRWFAGYYDVTLDTGEQLARSTMAEGPGGVVLAFVVAAGDDDCTPTWGKAYTLDDAASRFQLDRRVERLRREGRPLAVSFGGAINTELAAACSTVDALTQAYRLVLDRYGIDVIDLDIEGDALRDTAATTRRAAAVAQLQRERAAAGRPLDVWLTLPVAPDGLTDDGLGQVASMLDAGVPLAGVNAMTMNFTADDRSVSLADLSIGALRATAAQLETAWNERKLPLPAGGAWSLLGATPMIGQNDVEHEVFSLDDAHALAAFADEVGLERVSLWSVNRDRTCGTNYPHPHTVSVSCSGVEQAGETFSDVLGAGRDGTPSGRLAPDDDSPVIADDPEKSPFPVWSSQSFYSAGVFVVWHGSVYVSKWWNEDGAVPDDPTLDAAASAWTYVGPVLPGDQPYALPQLPAGTYPEWVAGDLYNQGDRVMYNGSGYEAKWWSRGQRPDRSVTDRDYSPWKLVTEP